MKRSEILKTRELISNQNTVMPINEVNTEINKLKEDFSKLRNEFSLIREKVDKINAG